MSVAMVPASVTDGATTTVTFSCIDSYTRGALSGTVTVAGVVLGHTNEPFSATFKATVSREFIPGDPTGPPNHRIGRWEQHYVYPVAEVVVPGYASVSIRPVLTGVHPLPPVDL